MSEDPYVLGAARRRFGSIARAAQRTANNERVNAAKRIMAGVEESARRRADRYEQAAAFLRRKGYSPVYDRACVLGTPHKGIQVGRRVFADRPAVIAFAAERGWEHG